jgi:DNA-binding transcriptional LysR family regulator
MRLRQIEVFHAVMQAGTVRGAARLLNVTQPAVTQTIQNAESELGIRLFARVGGRLVPTNEARLLSAEVEKVVNEIENVRDLSRNLRLARAGHLRIAATHALALDIVPNAIARLQKERKKLTCSVTVLHRKELARAVLVHDIDVGLMFEPSVHPGIEERTVGTTNMVVAVSLSHPSAYRKRFTVGEIAKLSIIGLYSDAPPGTLLQRVASAEDIVLSPVLRTQTSQLALALVVATKGIAIIDGVTARSADPRRVRIADLAPRIPVRIAALWSRSQSLSPPQKHFIELARKSLAT